MRRLSIIAVLFMMIMILSPVSYAKTKESHFKINDSDEYVTTARKMFDKNGLSNDNLITDLRVSSQKRNTRDNEHYITQTFSGYLEEENGYLYVPFTLGSGQIVQGTLFGPHNANINYDLLLYTYDNETLGTMVASCGLSTYINTYSGNIQESVPDAVSYINTDQSSHSYILFVYATSGYSSSESFDLTISIDSNGYYDSSEPDDNPFHANSIQANTTISGKNLNVINDMDWFEWEAPSSVFKATFDLSNSNYTAEMYTASGTSMIQVLPNSLGEYSIGSGYYYICIRNRNSQFDAGAYTFKINPSSNSASNVEVVSVQSDTSPSIANYGAGSYARAKRNLTITVKYTSSEGYPVVGQSVSMTWQSETWIEQSGNKYRYSRPGITTDANGNATFVFSRVSDSDDNRLPTAIGQYMYSVPGPVSITHHYDVAYMLFYSGGVNTGVIPMYHLAYSD